MSVHYLPDLTGITPEQPFRFWCQKVLPLVYDDSLSYYELLCKVVNYLNNTMQDVNALAGDVSAIATAYTQLETYVNEYFDNLDVQEEINSKLDEMAEDGSLTALISPLIPPVVTEWLEENIQPYATPIDSSLTIEDAAADAKVTGENIHAGYAITIGDKIAVDTTNKTVTLKAGSLFYWDGGAVTNIAADVTYTESDLPASVCKVYIKSDKSLAFMAWDDPTPISKDMGLLGYIRKSNFETYSPTNNFSPETNNAILKVSDNTLTEEKFPADAKVTGENVHSGYAITIGDKIAVDTTNKTVTLKAGSLFYWDGGAVTNIAADVTYREADIPSSVSKVYIKSNGTLSFLPFDDPTPVNKGMGLLGYIRKSNFEIYSPTNNFTPETNNDILRVSDDSLTEEGFPADAKITGENVHSGYAITIGDKIAVDTTNKTVTLKAGSLFYWDGGAVTNIAADVTYTESDLPASVCKVYIKSDKSLAFMAWDDPTPISKDMGLLGYIRKSNFEVYSPTNNFTPETNNNTLSDIIRDAQSLATAYEYLFGLCFVCLCGKTLFIDCCRFRMYNKLTTSYTPIINGTYTLDGDYSQRFIQYDNNTFSLSATFNNKCIALFIRDEGIAYPLIKNIICNRRRPLDAYVRSGHMFNINLDKYKITDYDAIIGYSSPEVRYNKGTYRLGTGTKYIAGGDGNYTFPFTITENTESITNLNVLMIGDSFFARGYVQNFLHAFDATLNFIGSKITQYYNYQCEAVAGSRLYYFTDPETSPFAYPDGTLGLSRYLNQNNLPVPDIVVINSAINQTQYEDSEHGTYLEQLTTLVNLFKNYASRIKVYVTHGANYAVSKGSTYGEPYNRFNNVLRCINAIYDTSLDNKCVRIPIFTALDDELDYTGGSVTYFDGTANVLTDCVHPTEGTGFKKIAEQIYNYLGL